MLKNIENPATVASGEPGQKEINDVSVLNISSKKSSKLNRRRAVRHFCLDCSGFSIKEVRECQLKNCPLHEFRMGAGYQDPLKRSLAIREYCLKICMMDQRYEVSICHIQDCPLWQYRQSKKTPYTVTSSDAEINPMPVHDQGEL